MTTRRRKPPVPVGFEILEGLQPLKPVTLPRLDPTSDDDVVEVKAELERLVGGPSALVARLADVIRRALDRSYDGAVTGRFHLAQLSKTEKAHTGSLFEIEFQRSLELADGHDTDYQVLQFDVDAKYTHSTGTSSPSWMIGPEIEGKIGLLATADDYKGKWSAWLVWVAPGRRNAGLNRDAKASLSAIGRRHRVPIAVDADLPPNNLLQSPSDAYRIMRMQGYGMGQKRINELCRRFEGHLLSRTTIVTVAQQLDAAKRMRADGGARSSLASEGILILGYESQYRPVAERLSLPTPKKGEFLPLRVAPAIDGDPEPTFRDIDQNDWRRARPGEPTSRVPRLA